MKKVIIIIIFFIILPIIVFSQDLYYWGNGNKVIVNKDYFSFVIYEKTDAKYVEKKGELSSEYNSTDLGNYKIVKSASPVFRTAVISSNYSFAHGLVTNLHDTLYPTNYIILKFKDSRDIENLSYIFNKYSIVLYKKDYNVYKLFLQNIDDVLSAANEIYETDFVEWCRPNFVRKSELYSLPKDNQYYVCNRLHSCGTFGNDLNLAPAWMITKGCPDIKVAVLDDGVEDHPALTDIQGNSRVIQGYSVPNTNSKGRPDDSGKHGQCCAGIIAASHSDSIQGIAPNITVVPVNLGFGYQDEYEWFMAMNWAWEPDGGNADILSNSWGPAYGSYGNELYIEAINNAQIYGRGGDFDNDIPGLGSIVVFAAGNNGLNEVSDYAKESVAVGAIDKFDTPAKLADGSRYTNIGEDLDLVAYGGSQENFQQNGEADIYTIDRVGSKGYSNGDYYSYFSGTSAACPMVSGVAALMLSINHFLTRSQVENILFESATDLGQIGKDNIYGYGKVNAYNACIKTLETITDENFVIQSNLLPYQKVKSNFKMIFSESPACGISAGTYFCDVYRLTKTVPLTASYIGDGLSAANPNNGKFYINTITNSSSKQIQTYFYHVKNTIHGQVVNKWVPQNISLSKSRTYIDYPEYNITNNAIIPSGDSVSIIATNSITLENGFFAEEGSEFHAFISITSNDIGCLPNISKKTMIKPEPINFGFKTEDVFFKNDFSECYHKNQSDVVLYPNPCNGNFCVVLSDKIIDSDKIEIYTVGGKLLYSTNLTSNYQNVSFTNNSGTYIVKIYHNGSIFNKKIVLL